MAKSMTETQERKFHETAQRNALGGYIGCDGPQCWKLIQSYSTYAPGNSGQRIQSAR